MTIQFRTNLKDTALTPSRSRTTHRATGKVINGKPQTKCGRVLEGKVFGGSVATPSNCKDCGPAWNQYDVRAFVYQDGSDGLWYGYAVTGSHLRHEHLKNFAGAATETDAIAAIKAEYARVEIKTIDEPAA